MCMLLLAPGVLHQLDFEWYWPPQVQLDGSHCSRVQADRNPSPTAAMPHAGCGTADDASSASSESPALDTAWSSVAVSMASTATRSEGLSDPSNNTAMLPVCSASRDPNATPERGTADRADALRWAAGLMLHGPRLQTLGLLTRRCCVGAIRMLQEWGMVGARLPVRVTGQAMKSCVSIPVFALSSESAFRAWTLTHHAMYSTWCRA